MGNWSFLQKESSRVSCAFHSHCSLDDFSTTCLCQCLALGRIRKCNHATRTIQSMMLTILSKGTMAALCQLQPLPLDLVPPLCFNY